MTKSGIRLTTLLLASATACALALPAGAQLLVRKDLSAAIAISIVQTTIETCKANGYNVSSTVVGRNGEILAQVRGDNTGPHTTENSFRKAYTAGTIHLTNIIANQGALPIKVGEEVIGASGAPGGEKDEACVKAGIDKVADQLK